MRCTHVEKSTCHHARCIEAGTVRALDIVEEIWGAHGGKDAWKDRRCSLQLRNCHGLANLMGQHVTRANPNRLAPECLKFQPGH